MVVSPRTGVYPREIGGQRVWFVIICLAVAGTATQGYFRAVMSPLRCRVQSKIQRREFSVINFRGLIIRPCGIFFIFEKS